MVLKIETYQHDCDFKCNIIGLVLVERLLIGYVQQRRTVMPFAHLFDAIVP